MEQPLLPHKEFSLSPSVIVLLHKKYIFVVKKITQYKEKEKHLNHSITTREKTTVNIFKYLLQDFSL